MLSAPARGCTGRFRSAKVTPQGATEGDTMDHAATTRHMYELLSNGDVDGFGKGLADDFVEHEETPGLAPTKDGVLEFFRMQRAAFPDLSIDPEAADPWAV